MATRPLCEPIDLPLGRMARVERVDAPANAPPVTRLMHFHDLAEIVLFGETRGLFFCDGRTFVIEPHSAVYAPSLRYHDFELGEGRKDWILIQIDPYFVQTLGRDASIALPVQPFAAILDEAARARMASLTAWLLELVAADPSDPLIERVVGLILTALCRMPRNEPDEAAQNVVQLSRFLPVIERLRRDPGAPIILREAATMCNLSPAYFSRRFTQTFGCGLSSYIASYRLHLAARRIATTDEAFAQIGYGLGFSSPSHFTSRFRERFGMTPRAYRQTTKLKH